MMEDAPYFVPVAAPVDAPVASPGWKRKRRRLWFALALLLVLLAIAVMPPMVSIGRYKSRITHLMSESLGRPVRLSSVELRLLPLPGFVLTDLAVEEDPAYGAEPVLRANTVTASIRLTSLWRGKLEIGTISVDEASLNVVRTPEGRWNLDSLFRTATAKSQASLAVNRRIARLPYFEASNSRINFKRGAEKLPFSLVNTDLSLWQEEPGDWRIRLRGQPARTDLDLDLGDTGIVRLEARAQRSTELRLMPLHVDMEWREAQLGQLARILIGSDPGWRGDLTGEFHLEGTADVAQIKTRLRATGVHRAEFAPAAPLDFDANCGFFYHFSQRSLENLVCDSPLGDGWIKVAGDLPSRESRDEASPHSASPHFSIELDRVPAAAGLDALRTVRSDITPDLEAKGSISGKISYAVVAPDPAETGSRIGNARLVRGAKSHPVPSGPLTGSLAVDQFELRGNGFTTLRAIKMTLEPGSPTLPVQNINVFSIFSQDLNATVPISAGGAAPLNITARLALSGYQLRIHGLASLVRAKELACLGGWADAAALAGLTGGSGSGNSGNGNSPNGDPVSRDSVNIDLDAEGPWLPPQNAALSAEPQGDSGSRALNGTLRPAASVPLDTLSGTLTLRNANWRADYLANPVEIAQATLRLSNAEMRFEPVDFSYGPVKGTASLEIPRACPASVPCGPGFARPSSAPGSAPSLALGFQVQFANLDAGVLQAAILGAREQGTLLSTLIDRLKPSRTSSAPGWPSIEGTVKADALVLGPVTLTDASASLKIDDGVVEIGGIEADLLGGHVHGSVILHPAGPNQATPSYSAEGQFAKLSPAAVGRLLGATWTGRNFDGDGKIDLSGFTEGDLASTAKGSLHFDWQSGGVTAGSEDDSSPAAEIPSELSRFDRWTADAEIANGSIVLKTNQVQQGSRKRAVAGAITLAAPPAITFVAPKPTQARR